MNGAIGIGKGYLYNMIIDIIKIKDSPTAMCTHSARPLSRSLRSRRLPFQESQEKVALRAFYMRLRRKLSSGALRHLLSKGGLTCSAFGAFFMLRAARASLRAIIKWAGHESGELPIICRRSRRGAKRRFLFYSALGSAP